MHGLLIQSVHVQLVARDDDRMNSNVNGSRGVAGESSQVNQASVVCRRCCRQCIRRARPTRRILNQSEQSKRTNVMRGWNGPMKPWNGRQPALCTISESCVSSTDMASRTEVSHSSSISDPEFCEKVVFQRNGRILRTDRAGGRYGTVLMRYPSARARLDTTSRADDSFEQMLLPCTGTYRYQVTTPQPQIPPTTRRLTDDPSGTPPTVCTYAGERRTGLRVFPRLYLCWLLRIRSIELLRSSLD
jgi:hypothetical protein